MSMQLGIAGGSMEITDDGKTIVSQNIADQIKEHSEKPDNKDDWQQPDLVIKD